MSGSRTRALAMATRCFCPPDICTPLSPTGVSKPSGNYKIELELFGHTIDELMPPFSCKVLTLDIKFLAFAISLDLSIVSLETLSLRPIRIFSPIVPLNRTGSCPTKPILQLNFRLLRTEKKSLLVYRENQTHLSLNFPTLMSFMSLPPMRIDPLSAS